MSLITQGFSYDDPYDAPDPQGTLEVPVDPKEAPTPQDVQFG